MNETSEPASTTQVEERPRCIIATQMREHGFSGGQQVHVAAVRTFLEQQGWDTTLVTPFSGPSILRPAVFGLRYALKYLSGQMDVFWYRYGHALYLAKALKRELSDDSRPAVIYAQDPPSADVALKLRRPGKDKVVMIVHFNESQAEEWRLRGLISKDGWLYRQILEFEARILPKLDKLIYVSAYMEEKLESRIPGLSNVPHAVIPNFVEAPQPDPTVEPRDLIAIGTLEPRKNQAYILRVIALLAMRGSRVTATIVGDGEDRSALEKLAQQLDIAGQIFFAGNVRGAARWIAAHRLMVHGAQMENCPISLIESLAAGVPIIAAAVGGIPEIVDAETGDFWDLSSVEDGADRVDALLANPVRLAVMQNNCRSKFAATFAPEIAAQRLLDEFASSLKN